MLIARKDLAYHFKGATFNLSDPNDRQFLGWVLNQFLYGEVTGIQCGYWLYRAPNLEAAFFLARQAREELSHIKRILRIQALLGIQPGPAHSLIRFLASGMMGKTWGEHVAMEMALGEGLVLPAFYALSDTVDSPEIRKLVESAIEEEEGHVRFGEAQTQQWLSNCPGDRKFFLALALVQIFALRGLRYFLAKRFRDRGDHPILGQLDTYFLKVIEGYERRIELLGISEVPIRSLSFLKKSLLIASIPFLKMIRLGRRSLLTDTYLSDPWIVNEAQRKT